MRKEERGCRKDVERSWMDETGGERMRKEVDG